MAKKFNLEDIIQGDSIDYRFDFNDGTKVPIGIDVTNWTLWISFKSKISLKDGEAELLKFHKIGGDAGDPAHILDDAINGIGILSINSIESSLLKSGKYFYSIQRVDNNVSPPDVKTLIYGTVKILEDINTSTSKVIIPDQFSFLDQTDSILATEVISNGIKVLGINFPTAITVSGDASSKFSINNQDFTNVATTVKYGDIVRVSHTTSDVNTTLTSTTLDIGTITDQFTTTTV